MKLIRRIIHRIHMHFESKKNWSIKMNTPMTFRKV